MGRLQVSGVQPVLLHGSAAMHRIAWASSEAGTAPATPGRDTSPDAHLQRGLPGHAVCADSCEQAALEGHTRQRGVGHQRACRAVALQKVDRRRRHVAEVAASSARQPVGGRTGAAGRPTRTVLGSGSASGSSGGGGGGGGLGVAAVPAAASGGQRRPVLTPWDQQSSHQTGGRRRAPARPRGPRSRPPQPARACASPFLPRRAVRSGWSDCAGRDPGPHGACAAADCPVGACRLGSRGWPALPPATHADPAWQAPAGLPFSTGVALSGLMRLCSQSAAGAAGSPQLHLKHAGCRCMRQAA